MPCAGSASCSTMLQSSPAYEAMLSQHAMHLCAWQAAGADVKRILVTRLVGHTYYARILLGLPGGAERSVDARPSDSLALALACSAPVFVSKQVAR